MLVAIPWQSNLLVHADLLVKLEAIRASLGRPPMLYGPNSGWRSHAQQKALYDAYKAGTGNPASNPDTGNRTHMRGVAADLRDTSRQMQEACVAVGLERDPAEAWHWQLPNWRNYPIITELPDPESTKETNMPILVSLVQGNPPQHVGDYAIIGDGGVVGLQRDRDKQLIETARRAMWEREPIYGSQADALQAVFAKVAAKPALGADFVAELVAVVAKAVNDDVARRMAS